VIKYELLPRNKHIVVENVKTDEKIGSGVLFAPGNMTNVYKIAKVIAVASCDETKEIQPGDNVLYDSIGAVDHRVGNQTITTVKALNVIGVVRQQPAQKFDDILEAVGATRKEPTKAPFVLEVSDDDLETAQVVPVNDEVKARMIELSGADKPIEPGFGSTVKIGVIELPKPEVV
jgi:co-chaperonin GroES (HSP10)